MASAALFPLVLAFSLLVSCATQLRKLSTSSPAQGSRAKGVSGWGKRVQLCAASDKIVKRKPSFLIVTKYYKANTFWWEVWEMRKYFPKYLNPFP